MNVTLPAIVLPFHDTDGLMFSHLESIRPQLKMLFERAFISISPLTVQTQTERISQLQEDKFFVLNFNQPDTLPGDHFLAAYQNAATACPPTQILHLCTVDRVIFALQSNYKDQFIADLRTANSGAGPLLFQRSATAWKTHPQNYREIEGIATKIGELLFGKSLDFVWCHLVIRAQQLKGILPQIKNHDLSILAEIVLMLKDKLTIKDADWLSWEDPFIFGRDPDRLKQKREKDHRENRKRLAYLMPVMQLLLETIES